MSRIRRKFSPSRRQFIRSAGAVAIAGSFFPLRTLAHAAMSSQGEVAILGAGSAGLAAAYTLKKAGICSSIYEASPRVGGRIFTCDRFTADGMFCEYGGELVDSSHTALIQVAHELGVRLDHFQTQDAGLESTLYYLGGRLRTDAEFNSALKSLAKRVASDLREVFPDPDDTEITYKHHSPGALKFDRIPLAQYLDGLSDSVEPWLLDMIRVDFVSENGLDLGDQSSLNLLVNLASDPSHTAIMGGSDQEHRIHGGNSRLIEAMQDAVKNYSTIHLEHRLVKIADNGQKLALSFANGKTVSADRVICTIPFSVLREVEGIEQLGLSPVKLKSIKSLSYGVANKYTMAFSEKFWRMPNRDYPACTGEVYTDLGSQYYWETSRAQTGSSGLLTNFLGAPGRVNQNTYLDKVLSDLTTIYQGVQVKDLYDRKVAHFDWGKSPFSRGMYSSSGPGQMTALQGAASEPELGGRLQFAGEHTSMESQGFMNGGIESGITAAQNLVRQS